MHPMERRFAVFSEFQLVNLAKLAILHTSDESGTSISTDGERFRFGKCCLMMHDLLIPEIPILGDTNRPEVLTRLIETMIPIYLFQDHERFEHTFVRAHELFGDIPKQMQNHPQFFDIASAFEEATGMSVSEYLGLGWTLWKWWSGINMETIAKSEQIVINPKTFFKDVHDDQGKCEAIFDQFSLPADAYRAKLEQERDSLAEGWQFRNSNVTIEKYPLVGLGEVLVCVSMKCLTRKLTTNLFFIVNNSLPEKEMVRFRTFFGHVFEEYVRSILKRSLQGRCLIENYGKSQEEAAEAILVYPRVLVIVEAKSSRLSLETVRSGEIESYRTALKKVVVAGCKQIERVIQDFKEGRYTIKGVDPNQIDRFYLLIVTIHSFPQETFIRKEIDRLLAQECIFQDTHIAPVTLVSIEELEYLEPLLETLTMVEMLGEKTGNPTYHEISMKNFLYSRFGTPPINQAIRSRYHELGEYVKNLLFGEGDHKSI